MNKRPNDYEGIKKMGLWKIGLEQSGKDYIEPKKIKNELVRVPCLVVTPSVPIIACINFKQFV